MTRRAQQAGYSLIEALIAVAILAAIAGALAPITHAAIRAAARISAGAEAAEEARVGQSALLELFASMIVPGGVENGEAFIGTRHSMKLFVLIDQEAGPSPIELRINKGSLYYAPPPIAGDRHAQHDIVGAVLLAEDVDSFRYFGPSPETGEDEWRSDWREDAPPSLVEIAYIKKRDDENRAAQSFALPSRAPLHCAFDQVSRQCRN